ncbi:Hypoxanthine-guanine phosphoribosyltransferase [Tetrabaena socialis]|uniref:Hypoxanthine-guanine phosphoribosyltransferase n=1 Tax=Tetrabaena socialis TaxID=47790 RepID=A0A2J8A012_9CHLO|nr:Hypoxanthine-guanine phosphoribosyltransferase [Tetrabaena socialis]|eukprot:PNH05828.1 Hypoxanthine-guanine phosphoribosyltransferase [Tetrabaena socialis]
MFTTDLVRHVYPYPLSLEVDFFKASSYGSGTSSSGVVRLDSAFDLTSVQGKHVLLVEDIIDTGNTLSRLVALMNESGAATVRVCALLDKKARRRVPMQADYTGFECPDAFIVGYGIDYAEKYRNLPYIGVPRDEFIRPAQ